MAQPVASRALSEVGTPGPSAVAVVAAVVSAAAALAVGRLGFAGVDVPAQVYRLHFFRVAGLATWDPGWYGGHQVLGYSVVFSPLANLFGLYGVAAASAALAAWCVHTLLRARFGSAAFVGTVVFTAGSLVPVAVGQLPYVLGQAIGLLAVVVAMRGRSRWAAALGAATPLASPVAGAFLALAATACLVAGVRRRPCAWTLAGTTVGLGVVKLLNAGTGGFSFYWGQLLAIFVLCGLGIWLLDDRDRTLRIGFALYALASSVVFVIPNPLGGNMGRLGASFGAAVAATVAWSGRRWFVAAVTVPLLIWQWGPITSVSRASRDASSDGAYYAGLLSFLTTQPQAGRVEVPLTAHHWEAAFVAPEVPLARGWERQLDMSDNAVFYGGPSLTPERYRDWLYASGVKWVALPDVAADYSATSEVKVLRAGATFLEPVWRDAHWQVWAVVGGPGLVTGPAFLTSVRPGGFTLEADPGTVLVRLRYGSGWTVAPDTACVTRTPQGWTQLTVWKAGAVDVAARLLPGPASTC